MRAAHVLEGRDWVKRGETVRQSLSVSLQPLGVEPNGRSDERHSHSHDHQPHSSSTRTSSDQPRTAAHSLEHTARNVPSSSGSAVTELRAASSTTVTRPLPSLAPSPLTAPTRHGRMHIDHRHARSERAKEAVLACNVPQQRHHSLQPRSMSTSGSEADRGGGGVRPAHAESFVTAQRLMISWPVSVCVRLCTQTLAPS